MNLLNIRFYCFRLFALALVLLPSCSWAKPVQDKVALKVAQSWIAENPVPMVESPSRTVWKTKGVRPFYNAPGELLAFIIDLDPQGFIITPADDEIEPILVFGTEGDFSGELSPENTLADILVQDIPYRVKNSDKLSKEYKSKISAKWARLKGSLEAESLSPSAVVQTASPVVYPLLTTNWDQGNPFGPYTYNYYTPKHYYTGCVATAMGMIIHYLRYPASAYGSSTITVDGSPETASFDDTFNYDLMPTQLAESTPPEQIQEVAKLLYDCGASVKMDYNTDASGAYAEDMAPAYTRFFGYPSAGWKPGSDTDWSLVLKRELNSGFPVEMAIRSSSSGAGHAVVCDGWGTEFGTDRFHLNMGWSGSANGWYSVPGFAAGPYWDVLEGFVCGIRRPTDTPLIIRVRPGGNDSNDGSSWALAKKTISGGLRASVNGAEVWVASGTYYECVTLKSGAGLYGGFSGSETLRSERNPTANTTVIDGNQSGSVVTVNTGSSITPAVIDGFTIRNSRTGSSGVYCSTGAATLTNNIVRGNAGSGIYSSTSQHVVVSGNIITANNAGYGGGIYCINSSATIIANTITGNTAVSGGGIYYNGNNGIVSNNIITGNTVSDSGGGVYCIGDSTLKIVNNIIAANNTVNYGGGVYCASNSSPEIVNNSIVGNNPTATSKRNGSGIYCSDYSTPTLANNIVAFNFNGIYKTSTSLPQLQSNCVYGNIKYDYSGLFAGTGDISQDPSFVDRSSGNYHLQSGSLCKNAGNDTFSDLTWADIDGQARISGTHVDMGADEWTSTNTMSAPIFSPGGGSYTSLQQVSVVYSVPDAVVRYTIDGSTPKEDSPSIVPGQALRVDKSLTLMARAWKDGWTPSAVTSAVYTITGKVAIPWFDPTEGTYTSPIDVRLTCDTEGAEIHYATGSSYPSMSSPLYTSPIEVPQDSSLTIRAQTYKDGWASSEVKSATYTVTTPRPVYVDKNAAGSTHDGKTWQTAHLTISEGLLSARVADEVWVAKGVYRENIRFKDRGLYGGFAVGETARDQRNLGANVTVIEGDQTDHVVIIDRIATAYTAIDGFTIRNAGGHGAGVVCWDYSCGTILNNMITANLGKYGINCYGSTVTIQGNTISDNIVSWSGGIHCRNSDVKILGNTITGNISKVGTVDCYECSPLISGNIISGNTTSTNGGGISCYKGSPVISDNAISDNTATYNGGGIDCFYSNAQITGNIITGCSASSGGGVSCYQCSPIISGNTISNNTVSGSDYSSGGGLYCSYSSAAITNNFISGNKTTGYYTMGGGIYTGGLSASITGNTISGNSCALSGAGIYCGSKSTALISRNTISQNVSNYKGGAISSEDASPTVEQNVIRENTAHTGGGMFCYDGGTAVILRNVITANFGKIGAGIECQSSSPMIINNLIVRNTTDFTGGGISCYDSSARIINNTISDNGNYGIESELGLPEIVNNIVAFNKSYGVYRHYSTQPVIRNNCVYANPRYNYYGLNPGTSDITQDPLFVNRENSDYHLRSGSPCIDAGSNSGAAAADINGAIRPQDGDVNGVAACDMGSYENPLNLGLAKKTYVNGNQIAFGSVPVTAVFPSEGCFYVGIPDRSSGIKVSSGQFVSQGEAVNVSGTLYTDPDTSERYVAANSLVSLGPANDPPKPLGIIVRDIGHASTGLQGDIGDGFGLNNLGLLVRVWGYVKEWEPVAPPAQPSWFTISDGLQFPIRVLCPSGIMPPDVEKYVIVTGISSCYSDFGVIKPQVKVRQRDDVVIMSL